ncbi:Rv3235 family protein [Nesterenkonia sp. Act20]|uniref:Rv3235 family protein n=1 Tax=Nesterenkonia sp. Act20 TaxID=1483432 RepID=UPI00210047EF|nr:Rv3235 family protein [Nesterenkonia sp. Act20]
MGPWATEPSDQDGVRYRLRREDEVPALLRRLRGAPRGEPQPSSPTEPPTTLATFREERRQICAISRIVCQVTSEVLLGLRPATQLSRWMDLEVQQKVQERAAVLAEARRSPTHRRTPASPPERAAADRGARVPRPQPLRFGTVRAQRAARGAWEVSVVFGDATRIRACAMRLEAHRRRWRVVAMELG